MVGGDVGILIAESHHCTANLHNIKHHTPIKKEYIYCVCVCIYIVYTVEFSHIISDYTWKNTETNATFFFLSTK